MATRRTITCAALSLALLTLAGCEDKPAAPAPQSTRFPYSQAPSGELIYWDEPTSSSTVADATETPPASADPAAR